jgi:DNA/RNA-binding domain of Phe-tRNA-synthetase-like protein
MSSASCGRRWLKTSMNWSKRACCCRKFPTASASLLRLNNACAEANGTPLSLRIFRRPGLRFESAWVYHSCPSNDILFPAERCDVPTVTIDEALKSKCPQVALACVTASVEAVATPPGLDAELTAIVEKILKLPEPRAVLDSAPIQATRRGYKALGKDPARYRGSAEALLRRVIAGKELPRINNVVDIINLVSVESRLSIGLYDLKHVSGDIVFRAGRTGETYKGIGKYDLNLDGLPVFCDAVGPHGSPTSDSERTMVTEATKSVLGIIISFGGPQSLPAWAERTAALLMQYALAPGAEVQVVQARQT